MTQPSTSLNKLFPTMNSIKVRSHWTATVRDFATISRHKIASSYENVMRHGTYDKFAYVAGMLHERRTNCRRNLHKISPTVRRHISRHSRDVCTMFARYSCEFLTTATAMRQLPDCRPNVARLLQRSGDGYALQSRRSPKSGKTHFVAQNF